MSRTEIKIFMLRVLSRMDGTPMPEPALFDSVRTVAPVRPLDSELQTAVQELEAGKFVVAGRDELTQMVSWMLTIKGQMRVSA